MNTLTTPMNPIYPFNQPGSDIVIHDGTIEVMGVGRGLGRVVATMRGRLNINWEVDLNHDLDLGPATIRVDRPVLGVKDVTASINHNAGRGCLDEASLGSGAQLARVVAHWLNLPWITPAAGLSSPQAVWCGRWAAEGGGWTLVLDSRQDIDSVVKAQAGTDDLAITYCGDLRRTDGAPFDVAAVSDALFGWQMAFSFALGRWVPPALPIGFDTQGNRAWEQWAPWRCDSTTGYRSWWDNQNGDDLREFMRLFLDRWCSPGHQALIRHVAHHLIAANQGATTTEARIMLVHAALDYFSWVKYVVSGVRSITQHKKLSADERLRQLLDVAKVPVDIPPDFPGLCELARNKSLADGPEAVTWVRNRLVHPKDAGEPYRIQQLVSDAWQLSMYYGELILLHELGYQGQFLPRFPARRFIRNRVPAPWSL